MKKHNKFIPVAVLAGLCVLAVSMNNEQCYAARSSSTTEYRSVNRNNGQASETTLKRTTKKDKNEKKSKRGCRKNGNCQK